MTSDIGGQGDGRKQQIEGGRWEGSSPPEEEEGVEVPSKIDFHDPKFTSTPDPYCNKNGCTHKVIDVLSNKGITNFTPVQAEAFVPVLAGRDVIRRS